MVLRQLQGLIAGIYDLRLGYDVCDFLCTDRRQLPSPACDAPGDEQVVVAQEPGETSAVALYLDPHLLERLAEADPFATLHAGNLADFWTALEGVSHFLYLAWHASHDRGVSLLELELQAEIDKYVTAVWLMQRQGSGRFPVTLHRLLFERARIDAVLAAGRMALYQEASRQAARYCRALERRLSVARHDGAPVLADLRQFYRLSRDSKVSHIQRLS